MEDFQTEKPPNLKFNCVLYSGDSRTHFMDVGLLEEPNQEPD